MIWVDGGVRVTSRSPPSLAHHAQTAVPQLVGGVRAPHSGPIRGAAAQLQRMAWFSHVCGPDGAAAAPRPALFPVARALPACGVWWYRGVATGVVGDSRGCGPTVPHTCNGGPRPRGAPDASTRPHGDPQPVEWWESPNGSCGGGGLGSVQRRRSSNGRSRAHLLRWCRVPAPTIASSRSHCGRRT